MRNPKLTLLAAIMVLFTVLSASAQNDIFFLGKNTGTVRVQFFADDGEGNFTLNICSKVVDRVCILGGIIGPLRATAIGENGFYKFTGGGITGTLTSRRNCRICRWKLSGPGLSFKWSSLANGRGTDFLNGTFQLLTMTQTKNMNGVGFNQAATADFIISGGTLAPLFCSDKYTPCFLKLNLQFTTERPLQRIPKGQSIFQRFGGSIYLR
jgi:hypothetical protein